MFATFGILKKKVISLFFFFSFFFSLQVRDRATYFRAILEQQQQHLNSQYILNGLQVSLTSLEKALHAYTLSSCEKPFDMKTVPAAAPTEERKAPHQPEGSLVSKRAADAAKPAATRHDVFVEKLSAIPDIAELGPLFKSSQPAELTGRQHI